jgi:hypothetical protein
MSLFLQRSGVFLPLRPQTKDYIGRVVAEGGLVGRTEARKVDEINQFLLDESLYATSRFYVAIAGYNVGSGSTLVGGGGLTAHNFTLVNGPPWQDAGIQFAKTSSQFAEANDFLGGGTLTCFTRMTAANQADAAWAGQNLTTGDKRSWIFRSLGSATQGVSLQRSSDGSAGTSAETYNNDTDVYGNTDRCFSYQWIDGGGRNLWQNKTPISLSLFVGSPQTSRFDTDCKLTIAASNEGASLFANMLLHAQMYIEGPTPTTEQRETLTDLINAL